MKIDEVAKVKNELKKVKLKEKPKNPDRKLNLKEIIFELTPELEKLKNGGYAYAEIAEILKQKGILISLQTLSKYLSDFRKKDKPKQVEADPENQPKPESESDYIEHDNAPDDDCVVFTINHIKGII